MIYTIEKISKDNIILNAGHPFSINLFKDFTRVDENIYKFNMRGIVNLINSKAIKVHIGEVQVVKPSVELVHVNAPFSSPVENVIVNKTVNVKAVATKTKVKAKPKVKKSAVKTKSKK